MTGSDPSTDRPAALVPPGGVPAALWWLILVTSLPELILTAADLGLVGTARWRPWAYQNGAFWSGLLRDWTPNYRLQPATMFVTYAFLHSGMMHLATNMLGLFGLGTLVAGRIGTGRMLALYFVSVLGGAAAFGLLYAGPAPMVGASGAVFGLLGAWLYWDRADLRQRGAPTRSVWRAIGALVVLNAVFWVLLGGGLAWETHLGGFVAGWAGAVVIDRRARRRG